MYTKYFIAIILILLLLWYSNTAFAQSSYPNYSAMSLDRTLTNFVDAHTYAAVNNAPYMAPPESDIEDGDDYPCPTELKQDLNRLARLYNTKNLKTYKKALNKLEQKYIDSPSKLQTIPRK
jgi:hypothetical protein